MVVLVHGLSIHDSTTLRSCLTRQEIISKQYACGRPGAIGSTGLAWVCLADKRLSRWEVWEGGGGAASQLYNSVYSIYVNNTR